MSHRRAVAAKAPSSAEVIVELSTEELDAAAPSSAGSSNPVGALSLEAEETAPLAEGRYDNNEESQKNMRTKHWLDSPFAVGLTEPTWLDERLNHSGRRQPYREDEWNADSSGCLCCSAFLCPYLGAGRVGNMAVLHSSTEWVEEVEEDEETGEQKVNRFTRPKLNCVMGPYWPMLVFCTYPLIIGVSGWAFIFGVLPGGLPPLLVLLWAVCTVGLIVSLALTACRDPGILYRHDTPPPQGENTWRWSEQAQTYRPRGSMFDPGTSHDTYFCLS